MRPIPLALLSAALLLPLPLAAQSPSGAPSGAPRPGAPAVRQGAMAVPLSGHYLAGRVAEQDHDYDSGADQFDLALSQAPGDLELAYDTFRRCLYAGRIEQ